MRGIVLYEGPSKLDRKPIVCILTFGSKNVKTGPMLQTWILRSDIHPVDAARTGQDDSICGHCALRGVIEKLPKRAGTVNTGRSCYVRLSQAPSEIYKAYKRGTYSKLTTKVLARVDGRHVRLGAYGDPVAVPMRIWARVLKKAAGHTGYTHQWSDSRFAKYKDIAMASVDSEAERVKAASLGWRTFRTMLPEEEPHKGEFRCPASAEAGYKLTCVECEACGGGDPKKVSVAINIHGSPPVMSNNLKRIRSILPEPEVHALRAR